MVISNRPGGIGAVLAVGFGFLVDALPVTAIPGLEDLGLHAGTLFLGLYALTVDRCEVPGFVASYRANLQNLFALAAASGLGTYDKPVVPGRRLSFVGVPLVVVPIVAFLICMADVARVMSEGGGKISPLDFDRFFTLPAAGFAVFAGYAYLTERIGLRRRLGTAADGLGLH